MNGVHVLIVPNIPTRYYQNQISHSNMESFFFLS